jgi:anti-sigma factor RsiW
MLMSLVLDDEATAGEATRLREHLVGCEACARTWQRWQELDRRFTAAPVLPAPVDFSVAMAARLDARLAEHRRRGWFMLGLALTSLVAMLIAVLALASTNGWPFQLLARNGDLNAAWAGVSSIGGWLLRAVAAFVERQGTPMVAAVAGALLCATCGLATAWLWMFARLSSTGDGQLVSAE